MTMVPTCGDMVQVRAGVVPVDAVTVNCLLCPLLRETVAGEIDRVTVVAGTSVTTAEAEIEESDVDAAFTVTCCDAVTVEGAV